MKLVEAAARILGQLADLVGKISSEDFSRPSEALGGSTIGQHVRHTLEFFYCFRAGYPVGVINYDRREHDVFIERDKALAAEGIQGIIEFLTDLKGDNLVQLEVSYGTDSHPNERIDTSIMRELVYNIEHAIHHMAMIRIALREVAPYIQVEDNFGIAASTVRHRHQLNNAAHCQ